MVNQPQLKRTCSACGLEKPLAAFLQLTGTQGNYYGAICSACRIAKQKQSSTIVVDEDSTTATTDKRIGGKEKIYIEQKKSLQFKDLQELNIKDAKKRVEETTIKNEQTDIKEQAEKDHRRFYIETKQKQGFLGQKSPIDTTPGNDLADKNIQQQQRDSQSNVEIQKQENIIKQEDIIKQEFQITSLDFSAPFIAGQTNQLRFQTDIFLKFKTWLGSHSPVAKTLDLLYQKNVNTHMSKNPVFESKSKHPIESIEEYVDQRLDNPSGSRRR